MANAWKTVWERHGTPSENPELADLLEADGFDTPYGKMSAEVWSTYVSRIYRLVGLVPGDSLYDVGCGSGAFLYPAYTSGITVGGLDYSTSLVRVARRAMPTGEFTVGEAAALDTSSHYDVVASCAVFLYFDTLAYAEEVIRRMSRKARRAVVILDIPDAAMAEAALAHRQAAFEDRHAYEERYKGLDHKFYDRDWVIAILQAVGLIDVRVQRQEVAGYDNAQFRFNVFGWIPAS